MESVAVLHRLVWCGVIAVGMVRNPEDAVPSSKAGGVLAMFAAGLMVPM